MAQARPVRTNVWVFQEEDDLEVYEELSWDLPGLRKHPFLDEPQGFRGLNLRRKFRATARG